MKTHALGHRVPTVADVARSIDFHQRILGMRPQTFGDNRSTLLSGAKGEEQKVDRHPAGGEFPPHAARPTPGPADLCLRIDGSAAMAQLITAAVEMIEGPVQHSGARGSIRSLCLRDPDGNFIELARKPTSEN